jgi:hypothetical protein
MGWPATPGPLGVAARPPPRWQLAPNTLLFLKNNNNNKKNSFFSF